jgi:hypothetical protein
MDHAEERFVKTPAPVPTKEGMSAVRKVKNGFTNLSGKYFVTYLFSDTTL